MTDEELAISVPGFATMMLGLPDPYHWQCKAIEPIAEWQRTRKRANICVVTPNGSGKDNIIIPTAVYRFLFFNPRGRVVVTSKSSVQLETQTLPNLNQHWRRFAWDEPISSPRWELTTPTRGTAMAFVTNDAKRVEGHHSRPDEPLMMVINEAKSFDLWEGVDRCTPDILLIVSSPGLRKIDGEVTRLYDICTNQQDRFTVIKAGLADCPHIPKEKIEHVIATYGEDHPVTRSTLYGEFMDQEEDESFCLTDAELEGCLSFPPDHRPGFKYGFFDFADGQAENVFVVRDGNKYKIADAWRDKNEDAVVGRAIVLMRRHNISQHNCGADAAAKSILDKMASAGLAIHRQNFGAPDKFGIYKSWSAYAWLEACKKIRDREIIIPDDPIFRSQATARKKLFTNTGKIGLEEKHDMAKRNVKSPDRFDAFVGCCAAVDVSSFQRLDSFRDRLSTGKHSEAFHGISVGL